MAGKPNKDEEENAPFARGEPKRAVTCDGSDRRDKSPKADKDRASDRVGRGRRLLRDQCELPDRQADCPGGPGCVQGKGEARGGISETTCDPSGPCLISSGRLTHMDLTKPAPKTINRVDL